MILLQVSGFTALIGLDPNSYSHPGLGAGFQNLQKKVKESV
jgi:hypothetical protein